jgi:hypothetical protein
MDGTIPDGQGNWIMVRDLILCQQCRELRIANHRAFYGEDWEGVSQEKS